MLMAQFAGLWAFRRPNVPLPALLGLDQKPQNPKQLNKYFFSSPLLSQRLSILKNIVGGRSSVIVVMGERGSGKTTLINQFIADTGRCWRVGRIRLRPTHSAASQLWQNLNNRMVFLSYKEAPPSLILDDAHQLSALELGLLLRSAFPVQGTRKIQSIMLFCEPQMRQRFAEIVRWLPQKAVIDKFWMTPLTEKQTAAYLLHRAKTAGFLKKLPFTRDQIRKIHTISRGLPGWINGEAYLLLKKVFGKSNSGGMLIANLLDKASDWASRLFWKSRWISLGRQL